MYSSELNNIAKATSQLPSAPDPEDDYVDIVIGALSFVFVFGIGHAAGDFFCCKLVASAHVMGFLAFLVIYIFGGLTFLPLLAIASFTYLYHTAPVVHKQESLITSADEAAGIIKTSDEKTLDRLKSEQDDAAGYFAVTREWTPGGINGKPPERITPLGATSIKGEEPSQSMYQTVVGSIFSRKGNGGKGDANGAPKKKRAANVFYVVLRYDQARAGSGTSQTDVPPWSLGMGILCCMTTLSSSRYGMLYHLAITLSVSTAEEKR